MSSYRVSLTTFAAFLVAAQFTASPAQAQAPQMSAKKPTAQVTATIAETAAQANQKKAKFDCVGPFTLTISRVMGAGAPMVYDFTIEFTGAKSARELGPGKCWRDRGWGFGPSLSQTEKGVLYYRVDMGKCPFLESLTIENGRITKYKSGERFIGAIWFDQAIRDGGHFAVETTYIGNGMNQNVPTPYAVVVPPDVSQRAATCSP